MKLDNLLYLNIENNLKIIILIFLFALFGLVFYKVIIRIAKYINLQIILKKMKDTPMIELKSLSQLTNCKIYAKCEFMLPFTSKDRMIKNILLNAKNHGMLNKDSTIYEGSSGSTAYSVGKISYLLGHKCKLVVPDDVSNEKLELIKSTGAEIIMTKQCPFSNFKDNFVRKAKKLSACDPNGFYVDQFFNKINYQTHLNETGPEIFTDLKGKIDIFVSSSGTGGTIGGISKYLKTANSDIKVILADINGSGLHSFVQNGVMFTKEETEAMRKKYRNYSIIEGIGINFLTDNFNKSLIDESYKITDDEAIFMANFIKEKEGLLIGGSSAVNLCAVLKAAKKCGSGKNIVTILYDSGEKYRSKLFKEDILNQINIKDIIQIF